MSTFLIAFLVFTAILALYWVFYGQRKYEEMLNPKKKTKLKAIIFDFDGVIIDSFDRQLSIFNDLRETYGLKKFTKESFKNKLWGHSLKENSRNFFKDINIEDIEKKYIKATKKHKEEGKLMDGAKDTFEQIRKKGIKTAIVTNTTRSRIKLDLELYKIGKYFETIVTSDDVERPKPYPDSILKACEKLKIIPEEAIYVGDTKIDYKAGKSAGCFMIGLNSKGDLIISELNDLLQLI